MHAKKVIQINKNIYWMLEKQTSTFITFLWGQSNKNFPQLHEHSALSRNKRITLLTLDCIANGYLQSSHRLMSDDFIHFCRHSCKKTTSLIISFFMSVAKCIFFSFKSFTWKNKVIMSLSGSSSFVNFGHITSKHIIFQSW